MQTEKIVELARAIIYAAATGTIIHVSGTNLSHIESQQSTDFSLNLQFAIVSSAILFIVMDGIARYCVRENTYEKGQPEFFVPGTRFVVEILGLFAFSYWIGLLLSKSDPFSTPGYIFLIIFSASCLSNNLLDVLVATRTGQSAGRVSLVGAFWVYGRVLIWGDIAETNIGDKFASIRRARAQIRQAVINPSCPVVTGNGGSDIWSNVTTSVTDWLTLVVGKIGVQGAWWRLVAQVGILHGIWFHFLAMLLSILLVVSPVSSVMEARVRDLDVLEWLAFVPEFSRPFMTAGFAVAVAFLAYVATSIKEQRRQCDNQTDAGLSERVTQTIGNSLLLVASLCVWYNAHIIMLYCAYGVLMVGAIVATMAGVRVAQPEPASA